MILKEFIELSKTCIVSGSIYQTSFEKFTLGAATWWHDRFLIDVVDGGKMERLNFRRIEDIPEYLLNKILVKWDLILRERIDGWTGTTIEMTVTN